MPICRCRGFTYLGLLLLVAIMTLLMGVTAEVWRTVLQREKEAELLFIGKQFKQAISRYYEETPSGVNSFPRTLEDLLEDKRFPGVKRHLRKLYPDPVTGSPNWGVVVSEEGGIQGVFSMSQLGPLKQSGFSEGYDFAKARSYSDWKFIYIPSASAESGNGEEGVE